MTNFRNVDLNRVVALTSYFENIINKLEASEIRDNGKDANGFFLPVRTLLFRHLNLIKDLHEKPGAKGMVQHSWKFVVEHTPPEWLILDKNQREELQKILS